MAKTKLNLHDHAEKAARRAQALWGPHQQEIVLRQMGHIFKGKGDLKQAEKWYRRASHQDPQNAIDHVFLGDLAFGRGRLREAASHFRRAVKCPKGPVDEAYYNLGALSTARQRYREAIEFYREAIRIDPKYAIARKRLKDAELALKLKNS